MKNVLKVAGLLLVAGAGFWVPKTQAAVNVAVGVGIGIPAVSYVPMVTPYPPPPPVGVVYRPVYYAPVPVVYRPVRYYHPYAGRPVYVNGYYRR